MASTVPASFAEAQGKAVPDMAVPPMVGEHAQTQEEENHFGSCREKAIKCIGTFIFAETTSVVKTREFPFITKESFKQFYTGGSPAAINSFRVQSHSGGREKLTHVTRHCIFQQSLWRRCEMERIFLICLIENLETAPMFQIAQIVESPESSNS